MLLNMNTTYQTNRFLFFTLLFLFGFAPSLSLTAQTIYYVDAAKANNDGDGTTWATAKKDLQVALDLADEGDEIRVASGTYLPTHAPDDTTDDPRDKAFHLDKDVVLKANYNPATDIQDYTNPTILSGDIGMQDDDADNAYHVLITVGLTTATIIEGFIFNGGNANGIGDLTFSSQIFYRDSGGGMYNDSSSPRITNSLFIGNTAIYGGGLCNTSSSSPRITNIIFSGNSATDGGGMYNDSSSPRITYSTFGGNTTTNGGGIYNNASSPTVTHNTFSENTATSDGGGIYNNASSPTVTNSTFSVNTARNGGGMFNSSSSSPTITNSLFSGNSATDGGGIYNQIETFSSRPTLINTVLYANTATTAGDDIVGTAIDESSSHNASDHTGGNIDSGTGFVTLTEDPFIDSTDPDGADNIFGTADDGSVPSATSPLIDAGVDGENEEENDITGGVRIMGRAIDIGAYEVQSTLSSGIPDVNISTIHPNPATDVLNIEVHRGVIELVFIYNLSGEKIMSKKIQGRKKLQLDINNLASGVYIIGILSDQGSSQQQLVVQQGFKVNS